MYIDSIKTAGLKVHPYRETFAAACKVNIRNLFRDHTNHRYLQGSAQKIKIIAPTYFAPIVSTQINSTTALIGWTFFGFGIISFATFGGLYLFQNAERERWRKQNSQIIIDVTSSLSD